MDNDPDAPQGEKIKLAINVDCPNPYAITPTCIYTFKLGSGSGGGTVSPGNFLILALGGDRGGSDLRSQLAIGGDSCYDLNEDEVDADTEPGSKTGPVSQGLNTRFDDYSPGCGPGNGGGGNGGGGNGGPLLNPIEFPPDTNVMENISHADYTSGDFIIPPRAANQQYAVSGRRELIIPIIYKSEFGPGRDTVSVSRLGRFFLRKKVDCGNVSITAEYIGGPIVVGNGGYKPDGGAGDPNLTVPVLYR